MEIEELYLTGNKLEINKNQLVKIILNKFKRK